MAKIYTQLTDLIGHTPMLELTHLENEYNLKARLVAKLEFFNPGGSVKDRAALSMIEDAEKRGVLKEGAVIIEPTSGNTGVGLAWVGKIKGYRTILTMPETMSKERQMLLKALGAELVLTPGTEGMSGAIRKAESLRDEIPGAVILQQFENPANPQAHVETTAEEIWEDSEGQVDVFVAGVGTGGTVSGTGKGLKGHKPEIEIVGVEPASSAVLSGQKAGMHKIQGIGAGFIPKTSSNKIILSAIHLILSGGLYLPSELLGDSNQKVTRASGEVKSLLTPRQLDVLRLMGQGKPNKIIARELDLSEGTVKLHVTAILKALDVTNRTGAVIAGKKLGLID